MSILDQAIAWWHADRYTSGSLTWNDQSGNGHHAQFGSVASGSDTNDPTFLEYDGTQYLHTFNFSPNISLRSPKIINMPNQSIGDLEVEIDLAVEWGVDWGYPSGKDASTGNPAYAVRIQLGKTILLYWNETGGTLRYVESTAAINASAWERLQIKITLDVDNGAGGYDVKFYTRSPGGSYAQLGSTVTGGATTSVSDDDSTEDLCVGSDQNGNQIIGKYYRIIWKNGIDGTPFADIDMTDEVALTPGATSFTEKSSNAYTVTIPRGDFVESVVVNRNMFHFAGDDYFEVPDHDDLDFNDQDLSVYVVLRKITNYTILNQIIDKGSRSALNPGYGLYISNSETPSIHISTAATAVNDSVSAQNNSQEWGYGGVWNVTGDTLEAFKNGIGTGTPSAPGTRDLRSSNPLRFGATSNGAPEFLFTGVIIGVAIFRSALSDADMATIHTELLSDQSTPSNYPPIVTLYRPLNLTNWYDLQPILFSGSASDTEQGTLSGSALTWTSSLDAGIGTGSEFSLSNLSLGSHSITLLATDAGGLQDSASVDINVAFNQYPTGTIIFPNDGGNYIYGTGTPMEFTASGADLEDGTLTGSSLVWISDVDGNLGTGELLSVPSVTEGFHIITLTTTDSLGKQASSSVTINATSRDVGAAPPEEKEKTVWTKEVTTEELGPTHQLGYERQDQVVEVSDRGNQTRFADDDSQPISVTLEYIDGAVMAHLVNQVKLEVDAEDKRIAVPVEYASSERWKQFRKDGFLRDGAGVLQIPLLLFRKTRILKGKGMQSPINKYLDRTYQTGWNRHQTYDKFSVLNSIIPSKELISVRVPDYIMVNYEFVVWTDYVEQMNGILERLNFEMDNYWGQRNNFKFNVTVNDYQTETDISPEDNRVIKTEFSAEVKAYLLPETYYHTDKGVKTTSEKRYSYKKVMNIYEIDSGDRITED